MSLIGLSLPMSALDMETHREDWIGLFLTVQPRPSQRTKAFSVCVVQLKKLMCFAIRQDCRNFFRYRSKEYSNCAPWPPRNVTTRRFRSIEVS